MYVESGNPANQFFNHDCAAATFFKKYYVVDQFSAKCILKQK